MSQRYFSDWLAAFVEYTSYAEAPAKMYFWSGVSAVAGALQRKVWIDQKFFKWIPNFYIVLVAPPGIVNKSTVIAAGVDILSEVPGVKFGPDISTYEALMGALESAKESFPYEGEFHDMSPLTIASSELGSLLKMDDVGMIMLLIEMWDNKKKHDKHTKTSGNNFIVAPWVNLIAGTTPSWISENFQESTIGGGLASRIVFVYAERKEKLIAYPAEVVPPGHAEFRNKLIADLREINKITGEYRLQPEALEWGREWYKQLWANNSDNVDDRFAGYISRKQTHIHKLAIVLAASCSSKREIRAEDLALADKMLSALENEMPEVFKQIGRTKLSLEADRFLAYCKRRGRVSYREAYNYIHHEFPSFMKFEDMLNGCLKSGKLKMEKLGDSLWFTFVEG